MTTIVEIEYVDHGAQGEYGFFGKVVAKSIVEGMTIEEIEVEINEMKAIVGDHVHARPVEAVPAAT